MTDVDPVKNLPSVIESRRKHAQAMARPMLGVRMIGDPRYDYAEEHVVADLMTRRAVQYATEMLRKAGKLGADLSGVDAEFRPPATVTFITANAARAVIAQYTVSDRVMTYDPARALICKEDSMTSHPVPDLALEADIAILGKKGRGKTYTAKGLVERLLAMGRRVIVLDPLSTWWGLKAGPHGFPIAVLGGPHADLPITDKDGASLGRYFATADRSAVLDLGQMRKAELVRFATAFLEELYTANREPLWLVLEEADVFAPQQPMSDNARLLGEVDRIARRGRQYGFRLITLTQRPAKLNKDVLTQLSTLIALGITSPQDRDAIKAWVEGNADRDKAKIVVESLAGLKVGEGWVWAPDHDLLERVTFPKIKTPDTSATPKAGEKRASVRPRQDVDVAAIKTAMLIFAPSNEAGKNDMQPASQEQLAAAEQRGYERGYEAGARQAAAEVQIMMRELKGKLDTFDARLASPWFYRDESFGDRMPSPDVAARVTTEPERKKAPNPHAAAQGVAEPKVLPPPQQAIATKQGGVTSAHQRVLDALAWWRKIGVDPVHRARAAVVAGYSPKASTFGVYIAELAKQGLVDTSVPGKVGLRPEGGRLAKIPQAASVGGLKDMARGMLGPAEAKVFDVLYAAHPKSMRRADLAKAVGLSPTASTLGVYVSKIAKFGIIETSQPGQVRAADWLFSRGAA